MKYCKTSLSLEPDHHWNGRTDVIRTHTAQHLKLLTLPVGLRFLALHARLELAVSCFVDKWSIQLIQWSISRPEHDSGSAESQSAELTNCSIDWWYHGRDSNPQNSQFEWDTYANSITVTFSLAEDIRADRIPLGSKPNAQCRYASPHFFGTPNAIRTRDPDIKSIVLYLLSYGSIYLVEPPGIAPGLSVFQTVLRTSYNKTPLSSLHQLQQAAITKPSSNCQRSIYPENSNGYLDFSSKTATSSFICCELFLTENTKQLSVDSFHPLFKQTKSKML